ncbi:hypothetical protein CABS01_16256 [Colletotrichum abscissum]|nr:uncharacterized protein CABS01_16256 [Colletotrichum abscissum]KAK1472582.1 hypothetical protein CABS01_16256 [Colletotrichum abscissum]
MMALHGPIVPIWGKSVENNRHPNGRHMEQFDQGKATGVILRSPEWPPVISPFRAYSLVHRLHWPCGRNEADQTRHRHRDRGAGYPFHLLGPMAVSPVSSHQHPITRRACCPSTVDPFLRPISCPISSAGRSISPSAFDRRRALALAPV